MVQPRLPARRLRAPKNASAASSQVGSDLPRRTAAERSRARHSSSVDNRSSVAGRDEASLASILDQVREVSGAPSHGGQPCRQGLTEDRSVRLGVAEEDEGIGPGVETADFVPCDNPVDDHARRQVGRPQALPDAGGVVGVEVIAPGEVEGRVVGG